MDNRKVAKQIMRIAKELMSDDYQEYFEDKMDEYGVDSPTEIPTDKKDDFFEEVDSGWESEKEKSKKISSPLIHSVAEKYGKKMAVKLHSEALKQAMKYYKDERLQTGYSLEAIMSLIMESASKRLNGFNRRYK